MSKKPKGNNKILTEPAPLPESSARRAGESRHAGQDMRKSGERLSAILTQAIVGIAQSNLTGEITFVNDHFCEIIGFSREELLGKRWQDFTHPEDLSRNMALFEKLVRDENPYIFDKRYIRKNGEIIWVSISACVLVGADRQELGAMVVVVDITKRKQAEELLKKSYDEIADLYNHAPCGYHSLDKDGVIRRINDTELSWLGFTRDEVVGKMKVTDFCMPASQKIFRENYPLFMKRGFVHDLEFELIRKDGTAFFALINATAIYDGNGDFVMTRSSLQDITKRKMTEIELAKSEERARLAIDASHLALWDYDLVTGNVYLSDGWSQLLGGEKQPTITNIQELTGLVPADEQQMVKAAILRAAKATEISSYQVTHRVKKPGGGYIWIISEGHVTERAPDGRALRMIGTNRDITYRKRLEKEIQERRNEMDELQKLHVAAQTAAAMAHELNQPLLAIASYCGAARMLLQAGKPDLDKIRNAIEASEGQAHRAGQSIRELLEFLSMKEFPSESFDLNQEIMEILDAARSEHEIQFQSILNLEHGLPPVQANRTHVQKVLLNLLRNGVEAMQEAGVPLPAIKVTVRTIKDKNLAQATIQDNGPGFREEDIQRLFKPFYSTKAGGIGMGLAISRSLVEANGGQLWVDPQEGPGAIFHMTLPLAP